ncbi:hypothetical protein FPSE_10362 [Fusarium pseudograminearum CS3096]|uniref:Uncharacterized protein n=1 Tax=Fusarium pseudograminearum (strain CS3096) TaxID=1028729 RepID=K3V7I2_FUSPC|nr:hypothetical protein FPSE_10362 [Fusarium pseudograminearum CS3096]EKJ69462.1 hypothetical protein FPSE_10362 [Fusarium pseudograminearum CS3096]
MSGRKRNAQGAAAKQRPNKRGRMANDEPCEEAVRQAKILLEQRPLEVFRDTAAIIRDFVSPVEGLTEQDEEAVTERWNKSDVKEDVGTLNASAHSDLLRLWKLSMRLYECPPLYFMCPSAKMKYQPTSKNGKMSFGLYSKGFCVKFMTLMAHPCWEADHLRLMTALEYAIACRIDDRGTLDHILIDASTCPAIRRMNEVLKHYGGTMARRSIHKIHASARRRANGESCPWSDFLFHIGETVKAKSSIRPPILDEFLSEDGLPTLPLTSWDLEAVIEAVDTMEFTREEFRYSADDALKAWSKVRSGRDIPGMEQLPDLYEVFTKDIFRRSILKRKSASGNDAEAEASSPLQEEDEDQLEINAPRSGPGSQILDDNEENEEDEEDEEDDEDDEDQGEQDLDMEDIGPPPSSDEEEPDNLANVIDTEADDAPFVQDEVDDDDRGRVSPPGNFLGTPSPGNFLGPPGPGDIGRPWPFPSGSLFGNLMTRDEQSRRDSENIAALVTQIEEMREEARNERQTTAQTMAQLVEQNNKLLGQNKKLLKDSDAVRQHVAKIETTLEQEFDLVNNNETKLEDSIKKLAKSHRELARRFEDSQTRVTGPIPADPTSRGEMGHEGNSLRVERQGEAETQQGSVKETTTKSSPAQVEALQVQPTGETESQQPPRTEQNTVQTGEVETQEKPASPEEADTLSKSIQVEVSLESQDQSRQATSAPVNEPSSDGQDQGGQVVPEGSKAIPSTDPSQNTIISDLPKDLPLCPPVLQLQPGSFRHQWLGSFNTLNHPKSKPMRSAPTPTPSWGRLQRKQG